MKRIITILSIAFIALCSAQAVNHLDSAYYGFEDGDESFIANTYFSIVDEQVAVGDSALKFTTGSALSAKQKVTSNTAVAASTFSLVQKEYLLTIKVFKVAGSSLSSFSTINKSPWQVINWDISSIEEDKWVVLKQKVTINATEAASSQIVFQLAVNEGPGTLYMDDFTIQDFDYVMNTIEGNYLDHYYYGFEAGTEANVDGVFIPANSDDNVSFSYAKNEMPESNFYALKFDVPAGSGNDYSIQLGNKDAMDQPGSAVLKSGDYIASVKVYMDERNITQFTSPIQDNTATADSSEYKAITWTIPEDIALGEWVTLKQIVTIDYNTDSKVQIKVSQANLIDNTKGQVLYMDDMAFVDYVPSTQEEIYSFDGGLDGGAGVWFTGDAADFFSVSSDKTVTGEKALKFACTDVSALPVTKVQMGLGTVDTDNSFINLNAGSYDVKLKIWIEPGCTVTEIGLNIKEPWAASNFDLTTLARGEWVSLTNMVTLSENAVNSNFQIIVKDANYGIGTFYIDDITITETTATTIATATKETRVYPNPANNYVTIEATQGADISIYTLSGRTVKQLRQAEATSTISLEGMEHGIYLISVKTEHNTQVKKLQVK